MGAGGGDLDDGGLLAIAGVTAVVTTGLGLGIQSTVGLLLVWLLAVAVGGTVATFTVRIAARALALR